MIPTDFDNRRDVDLFLATRERARLFRNMRDGTFRDEAADIGLAAAPGPLACAAKGDVNKDGYEDFLLGGPAAASLAESNGRGGFVLKPMPAAVGAVAAQFVDYDNDGLLDAFLVTAKGLRLLRNLGESWSDVSATSFSEELRSGAFEGASLGIADLDGDGDPDADRRDAAAPARAREPRRQPQPLVRPEAPRPRHEPRRGRSQGRDPGRQPAPEARDERRRADGGARRGRVRPGRARGAGRGARDLGVGHRADGGRGRGRERRRAPGRVELVELDRKPSSCPYLYAWNGERFEFVTDFLGGGEMGYRLAPGVVARSRPRRVRADRAGTSPAA